MKLVLAVLCCTLLSSCNDPVGTWCGWYRDALYNSRPDWKFAAYFRFDDDGRAVVAMTGSQAADPKLAAMYQEWGFWYENSEGYTFETQNPKYPKFDYLQRGIWLMDGDEAEFTVWNRLFPSFSKGKAMGTAERCDVDMPDAPGP